MIRFEELQKILPDTGKGSVTLKLERLTDDRLRIVYARKSKEGDKEQAHAPMVITGTPVELNEAFERVVTEVVPLEQAEDESVAAKIEKRKKELADKTTKASCQTPAKKPAANPKKNNEDDDGLFAQSSAKKPHSKTAKPAETSAKESCGMEEKCEKDDCSGCNAAQASEGEGGEE